MIKLKYLEIHSKSQMNNLLMQVEEEEFTSSKMEINIQKTDNLETMILQMQIRREDHLGQLKSDNNKQEIQYPIKESEVIIQYL